MEAEKKRKEKKDEQSKKERIKKVERREIDTVTEKGTKRDRLSERKTEREGERKREEKSSSNIDFDILLEENDGPGFCPDENSKQGRTDTERKGINKDHQDSRNEAEMEEGGKGKA